MAGVVFYRLFLTQKIAGPAVLGILITQLTSLASMVVCIVPPEFCGNLWRISDGNKKVALSSFFLAELILCKVR
jgi:hypothetical protein